MAIRKRIQHVLITIPQPPRFVADFFLVLVPVRWGSSCKRARTCLGCGNYFQTCGPPIALRLRERFCGSPEVWSRPINGVERIQRHFGAWSKMEFGCGCDRSLADFKSSSGVCIFSSCGLREFLATNGSGSESGSEIEFTTSRSPEHSRAVWGKSWAKLTGACGDSKNDVR